MVACALLHGACSHGFYDATTLGWLAVIPSSRRKCASLIFGKVSKREVQSQRLEFTLKARTGATVGTVRLHPLHTL